MRYCYLGGMLLFFCGLYVFYEGYFIALVTLAFMVLFHEWGHFLAARACGVKVEVFSIGFGKEEWCLASYQWGQTQYRFAPILLGGYVRMKGQDDMDPTKQDFSPDSYNMQPPYKRILILLAGPFANLLLGFLALVLVSQIGKEELAPVIAQPESNTPAFHAGLKMGDEITAINGYRVRTWQEMSDRVQATTSSMRVDILREGEPYTVNVTPEIKTMPNIFGEPTPRPLIGIRPLALTAIAAPANGTPAQYVGLQKDDIITAVNGTVVWSFAQINHALKTATTPLKLEIERGNVKQILTLHSIPRDTQTFGIMPLAEGVRVIDYGTWGSIVKGFEGSVKMVSLMLVSLQKLIIGVVPASELGGVVMIMQVTSSAAESGVVALLSIAALISLNLGIVNLMPIPLLDGGHIVFNLYEMIFKRALRPEVLYRFTVAGALIVASLMILGLYNDINRILQ